MCYHVRCMPHGTPACTCARRQRWQRCHRRRTPGTGRCAGCLPPGCRGCTYGHIGGAGTRMAAMLAARGDKSIVVSVTICQLEVVHRASLRRRTPRLTHGGPESGPAFPTAWSYASARSPYHTSPQAATFARRQSPVTGTGRRETSGRRLLRRKSTCGRHSRCRRKHSDLHGCARQPTSIATRRACTVTEGGRGPRVTRLGDPHGPASQRCCGRAARVAGRTTLRGTTLT